MISSPRVLTAMSGGVDSSMAAQILKNSGYTILGATMKLLDDEGTVETPNFSRSCCSLSDILDARQVAEHMDFDFHVFNFTQLFEHEVIKPFIYSYAKGLTPNPCIECNRHLKFRHFWARAELLDCSHMATGHYARIEFNPERNRYLLKKARDLSKDQSYVLYTMNQKELGRTLFPLGDMEKSEVRQLADRYGLVNAQKPDSQDICFIREGHYSDFLEQHLPDLPKTGPILDRNGMILGQHRGIIRYTIGQRQGLGICLPHPVYVTSINPTNNTVTVGPEEDLFTDYAVINQVNLISIPTLEKPLEVKIKIRYRQEAFPAEISPMSNNRILVTFHKPQKSVTPGQAAVFYDGELVVGGGTIMADQNQAQKGQG